MKTMTLITPAVASIDVAIGNAVKARDSAFGRNFYDILVAAIPDARTEERFQFASRLNFRTLRLRVERFRSASVLNQWLRQRASLDEAIAVAWGLANVIGQIEECRVNGCLEHPLARYKDIAEHGHPVQICLFGLDYLAFCWD